jgi:[ribosomal protein S5]-alanine N-acetyltransferase
MLETTRLKLVPLTHEQLLLYKNDPQQLSIELNTNYLKRIDDPAVENDIREAAEFWLKNTETYREHFRWFTNWEIILKEANVGIGGIGFAGLPDENGKSMVGYGLDIRFHGKGYASEALAGILQWAYQSGLKEAIAETPLNHIASQKVLIKNNFRRVAEGPDLIHWSHKGG